MTESAPTRASLLLRIRDSADQDSWSVFVEIYGPLVFNYALRMGLQESDAADLVQEVMADISRCIARFEYNPRIGKFRSWLYKVAKRTLARQQNKKLKQAQGLGGTDAVSLLSQQAERKDDLQQVWNREYEQYLIEWASKVIRPEFKESVYNAFWLTTVDHKSPTDVAAELGMTVGNVYVAKSRVLKRLIEKVGEIDDTQ